MGGRAGSGGGAGMGSGSRGGAIGRLTESVVSKMSANQKTVYNQLVEGGVDKGYAAYTVSKSWANSFKQQPMQYIQGNMAPKVIKDAGRISDLLKQKHNKQGLLKGLQSIA